MTFTWPLRRRHAGDASVCCVSEDQFVRFIEVQKTFDAKVLVIKNLNLDVRRGEFLTFLGPSGSGKTTALMLLAGFELPTGGTIELAGRSLHNVPPNRREIGMVFQSYALFPHKTIFENLAFPLIARKRRSDEVKRRVGQALEMVHLTGYDKRRPAELSGGQQQRVAVARALIFEPMLVLMDEPLSALDRRLREQMQIEIKHIHKTVGVTMIYVTHDQSEALVMSDRIAVFNQGRVEQLATPRELYREPRSQFVANFIGENNLLLGDVIERTERNCIVDIGDGGRIRAVPVGAVRVGTRAYVSIRSENVKIDPPEGYPNRFNVRVEEVIYLGDHTRLRVRLCGHEDFVIKIQADDNAPCRPQEFINIGWACEHSRVLAE
jgi:putative spermidine/putrescine transport system ATP-binding protein